MNRTMISLFSKTLPSLSKQSRDKSHKPRDGKGQERPGREDDSVRLPDCTGRRSAKSTIYKIACDRDEFLNAFRLGGIHLMTLARLLPVTCNIQRNPSDASLNWRPADGTALLRRRLASWD
jgi:hypothetical protein